MATISPNPTTESLLRESNHISGLASVEKELVGVAGGAAVNFIGKILGTGILYLYSVVVARMLGPQIFGLFILGLTIINLAGILCRLGLDNGIIKFAAQYQGIGDKARMKGALNDALKYSFVISIAVGGLLCLFAEPVISHGLGKPDLVNIVRLLSVSLPFTSLLFIALGFTMGLKIMKYWVYVQNLFWPLSNLLLAVLFLYLGFHIYGVVAAQVVSIISASLLALYCVRRAFPEIVSAPSIPETRRLFEVSFPLSLTVFLNFIASWTDTLMLGYFNASEEVGIYAAAMKTALLTSVFLLSFNIIFAPTISDLYHKEETQKLENMLKIITRWVFTISLVVFIGISLRARTITGLFGPEFVAGSGCLILLSLAQVANGFVGPVGLMLAMTGHQKHLMATTLGTCLLNVTLNGILIPMYGILGAAVATGTSLVALNAGMLFQVHFLLGMHPHNKKFVKIIFFGVMTYGVMYGVDCLFPGLDTGLGLMGWGAALLLLYAGMIAWFGFYEEDRFIFATLKQNILNHMSQQRGR